MEINLYEEELTLLISKMKTLMDESNALYSSMKELKLSILNPQTIFDGKYTEKYTMPSKMTTLATFTCTKCEEYLNKLISYNNDINALNNMINGKKTELVALIGNTIANDTNIYDYANSLYINNSITPMEDCKIITDNGVITKIIQTGVTNGTTYKIEYEYKDGVCVKAYWPGTNLVVHYDNDNGVITKKAMKYNPELDCEETISIFDSQISNQFCGNQGDLYKKSNIGNILNTNGYIYKYISEKYPKYSYDQIEEYVKSIGHIGCGYTAATDAIFDLFTGNEEEFLNNYKYDMYEVKLDGTIDYNYENMIVEIFDRYKEKKGEFPNGWYSNDYKIYENVLNEMNPNLNIKLDLKDIREINYGTESSPIQFGSSEFTAKLIEDYSEKLASNEKIMVASSNYTMYTYQGNKPYYVDSGHAMYLIGFEGNNAIVSSWGEKYKVPLNDGNIGFTTFKISGGA